MIFGIYMAQEFVESSVIYLNNCYVLKIIFKIKKIKSKNINDIALLIVRFFLSTCPLVCGWYARPCLSETFNAAHNSI
jgi:hypothetical protein